MDMAVSIEVRGSGTTVRAEFKHADESALDVLTPYALRDRLGELLQLGNTTNATWIKVSKDQLEHPLVKAFMDAFDVEGYEVIVSDSDPDDFLANRVVVLAEYRRPGSRKATPAEQALQNLARVVEQQLAEKRNTVEIGKDLANPDKTRDVSLKLGVKKGGN